MINRYYGCGLSEDAQKLVDYIYSFLNCHAYDESGALHGDITIKIDYSGFRVDLEVLESNLEKTHKDPLDE